MKNFFVWALAATSLVACGDQKTTETITINTDTSMMVTPGTSTTTTIYTPSEGDVIYRDGKVMVWRNNDYVLADNDVNLDDNVVVKRNGEVTRNGVVIKLEDGQAVSKTGRFFNKAGEAIEDAWDATKKGVNKAAEAVGKGAKKVGEEVKDAVH
jgi:hypothetical protein